MNAAAATAAQVITGTHPCACSTVVAFADNGDKLTTACSAVTKRTFAPGHDARLKGFLIRNGAEGNMVTVTGSGVNTDAQTLANRFGFGGMVADGIERAKGRAFAKLIKAAAKPAPKVAAPVTVTAKVGRWFYEGVILAAGDGTPVFRYTNKQGVSTDTMKFTQIG